MEHAGKAVVYTIPSARAVPLLPLQLAESDFLLNAYCSLDIDQLQSQYRIGLFPIDFNQAKVVFADSFTEAIAIRLDRRPSFGQSARGDVV